MRLPETKNAKHLYAFKKGFRLAYQGKALAQAPSDIRLDPAARTFFEQGWEQAQGEIAARLEAAQAPTPWRNRIAWYVMLVLGGGATALGLIHNIQQEKAAAMSATATPATVAPSAAIPQPPASETADLSALKTQQAGLRPPAAIAVTSASPAMLSENTAPGAPQETSVEPLGLLSSAQREDLNASHEAYLHARAAVLPEEALIDSPIIIEQAALSSEIVNKQPGEQFREHVPKPVRQLYFFTHIKNAQGQTLYHRWIYNDREMALIPLKIHSNLYRTWSSKRLTSAWQGAWRVELLDANHAVIYRQHFTYGRL